MTTQEKINKIISERYKNYEGRMNYRFKLLHDFMRTSLVPLPFWQVILNAFGFTYKPKLAMNDEQFLQFLEDLEIKNPQPKLSEFLDILKTLQKP